MLTKVSQKNFKFDRKFVTANIAETRCLNENKAIFSFKAPTFRVTLISTSDFNPKCYWHDNPIEIFK